MDRASKTSHDDRTTGPGSRVIPGSVVAAAIPVPAQERRSSVPQSSARSISPHEPEKGAEAASGRGIKNAEKSSVDSKKRSIIEILDSDDDDTDNDCKLPGTKKRRGEDGIPKAVAARKVSLSIKERKEKEQSDMYKTSSGRAFLLVERFIQINQRFMQESSLEIHKLAKNNEIALVGLDDMVFLAEKLLECQDNFTLHGKPTHASCAYHYTSQQHLNSIRQDGLLSHPERTTNGIQTEHKAHYGDGVYTANNPSAFLGYGDTGLLVAILKGKSAACAKGGTQDPTIDTVIGNKMIGHGNKMTNSPAGYNEIVLRQSCQVLPIFRFSRNLVATPTTTSTTRHTSTSFSLNNSGSDLLWQLNGEVQKVLDEFMNNSVPTVLQQRKNVRPLTLRFNRSSVPAGVVTTRRIAPAHNAIQPSTPTGVAVGGLSLVGGVQNPSNKKQAAGPEAAGETKEMRRQKERFLMFTRVLMKYLETKDPALNQKVKSIIRDCAERNKRGEPGYESVTACMRERLKQVVGEAYWKRAETYLAHFLSQKLKAAASESASSSGVDPAQKAAERKQELERWRNQIMQQRIMQQQQQQQQQVQQVQQQQQQAQVQVPVQKQQRAVAQQAQAAAPAPMTKVTSKTTSGKARNVAMVARKNAAVVVTPIAKEPSTPTTAQGQTAASRQQQRPTVATQLSGTPKPGNSDTTRSPTNKEFISYVAPTELCLDEASHFQIVKIVDPSSTCTLCQGELRKGIAVQLRSCDHLFHEKCIANSLQCAMKCEQCRLHLPAKPHGKSPSGAMSISPIQATCDGHEDTPGSIAIQYNFPSGTQLSYHSAPGQPYIGTNHPVFLPNNWQGRALLARFKYAWFKGLLFHIHETSGMVRSSVQQKMALYGGGYHAFPDPEYVPMVNAELDALGVPSSLCLAYQQGKNDKGLWFA